jgi:hypothetical protein
MTKETSTHKIYIINIKKLEIMKKSKKLFEVSTPAIHGGYRGITSGNEPSLMTLDKLIIYLVKHYQEILDYKEEGEDDDYDETLYQQEDVKVPEK